MPDVNDIYQRFVRPEQLQGQSRWVMVEAATVEVLGQGEKAQQKIVLKFEKAKQRLPLNKTNALALSKAWGPNTDNWIGRQVELRPEKVLFASEMVDTIRVVAVPDAPKLPPRPAAPVMAGPLDDAGEPDEWQSEDTVDDIPWAER